MVTSAGEADAQTEIDFPVGRDVEVNCRVDLMLLLVDCRKIGDRPNRAVVFQPACNFFREVVADLEIWRKNDALMDALTVEGALERGV